MSIDTGDYNKAFEAANRAAGLNQKTTPNKYVSHHLDDYDSVTNRGTMQLVEKQTHKGIQHSVGVEQCKAATGKSYTFEVRNHSSKKVGGTTC
ncbi:HNH endonuclease [Pseudomonas viridiflava]|uniref:HNH endonuclease n=1 Tax=Pseudomonas viridiflava TaxID=33069 RepID=UPI0013CE7954